MRLASQVTEDACNLAYKKVLVKDPDSYLIACFLSAFSPQLCKFAPIMRNNLHMFHATKIWPGFEPGDYVSSLLNGCSDMNRYVAGCGPIALYMPILAW